VLQLVKEKTPLLIVGAGGCGKTWLLKQMKNVVYTATTACAAELLGGCTIHALMRKRDIKNC
jgi:GTPase SAR1 family protein